MREPFRRGISRIYPSEDSDKEVVECPEPRDDDGWREELERRRRGFVFSESPRLRPARIEDIRGMPHIVEDIGRFIAFLKDYEKFRGREVRVQPGIFLYGAPGTGKTLTARVIATESGAKLINAGDFPREDVRWTAGDISSLFALAREYYAQSRKPVIVYFDEIDSVCPRERRYISDASAALMSELDGMGGKPEGIFVIAAANYRDVDEGLLRAGRLGHHIYFRSPDYPGRFEILKFYVEKKPHEPMDLEGLAKAMPRMTPAEIEELVERAYMEACLVSPDPKLTDADLIRQLLKKVLGPPTGTWLTDAARYRVCVHEAGHVIAGEQLGCPAKLVVVLKKGYQKGITLFDESREEEDSPSPEQMENQLAAGFGGEAAEELVFGERRLGCTDDVCRATAISIKLVANWGRTTNYLDSLVDGDPCLFEIEENKLLPPLDDGEKSSVYSEARRIRERCYERAVGVLESFGREGIERVARQIYEREFILGEEIKQVIEASRVAQRAS